MFVVILSCFCPHYLALRVKKGCHTSCSSPLPTFRQLPVFYGQLHTSFLHFHYRASFLRFATSLNNVRFVPSISISVGYSPPAAYNFCVPFGLLRLRVCHTFCKEKSSKKRCQTLASTVLPHALRAFGSPPLQAHAPSSVSNSIGFIPARFAFGGQVCHLGSTAFFGSRLFYLRQKKERGSGILFSFS